MTETKAPLTTRQMIVVAIVCSLFIAYHLERVHYWTERHDESLTLRHGAIVGVFGLIPLGQIGAYLSGLGRPGSAFARLRDVIATPLLVLLGLALMGSGTVGLMSSAWLDFRFCIFALMIAAGVVLLRNVFTVRDD